MAGRGLPPELVRAVLGYLEAGLNPVRAAAAAGVSKTFAYDLDRRVLPDLESAGLWRAPRAKGLEAVGATCCWCAPDTMHKVAPAVQAAVSVPLLHIIDTTAERVSAAGLITSGLLGVSFTTRTATTSSAPARAGPREG